MNRALLFGALVAASGVCVFVACNSGDNASPSLPGPSGAGDAGGGGGDSASPGTDSATGACAPGAGSTVQADWSFAVSASSLNGGKGQVLRVSKCDSVVWTNQDNGTSHSVVGTGSFAFDTGTKTGVGAYAPVQFTQAGTFTYQCGVHGSMMVGQVTVTEGAIADAGADTNAPDAGGGDSGGDSGTDAGCPVTVTIKDSLDWCNVVIDGGTTFTSGTRTVCADHGGTVNLAASPISGTFELGPAPWHDTTGDVDGGGDPGTRVGNTATTTLVVGDASTACAWVCCPFSPGGNGCPTKDQCP